jgi:adenylate cyclase
MAWLREGLAAIKAWLIGGGRQVDVVGYLVVLAVALGLQQQSSFQYAEWKLYDQSLRWLRTLTHAPVANDVVVIAADEASFTAFDEPFALWHKHLGALVDAMRIAEPAVVGLDIVLPAKSYESIVPGIDRELMAPLLKARGKLKLIVAQTLDENLRPRAIFPGYVALLGADHLASALLCYDEDSVVRRTMLPECGDATQHAGLAERMASALGAPARGGGLIDFRHGLPFPTLSMADVLRWQAEGDSARLRAAFAGKAVLVGVVLPLEDRLKAPVALLAAEPENRRIPGVLMHAQILRSLLNHGFIQAVPAWLVALFTALVCLSWFGYGFRKNLIYWSLFALLPLLGLYALWLGHALPPAALLVSAKLAYAARQALESMRQRHQRKRLTEAFAGHVDARLLQRVLATNEKHADLQPKRQPVTVLWAHLPASHPAWDATPPERASETLGAYYAHARAAIERAGGMVERFQGNSVLAYFGTPLPLRQPARAALEAALGMVRQHAGWAAPQSAEKPRLGIGIASGDALAGQIGMSGASPYIVLGDVVERAAALASATDPPVKDGARVLADPATAGAVEGRALEATESAGQPAYLMTAR